MSGNSNTDIWIAGAFAAFTVDILVYPLDTLKTRIQSPDYRKQFVNPSTNAVRKAVLFRGLYQGLGSVVIATLPSSGAFFTTYEGVKSVLTEHTASVLPQPVIHSLASGTAELVSCAILTPAEVIKQNAQMVSKAAVESAQASATRQTLQRFMKNPVALWRGYGALAGRNLPFTALQFPLFERFKDAIIAHRKRARQQQQGDGGDEKKQTTLPLWERGSTTALAAGSAGAIAAVITTPIDVVKTRIMLAAATTFADQQSGASAAIDKVKEGKVVDALGEVAGAKNKPKALSTMAITRDILREHGWRGLWRGGALRGAWTMLGSGLYLGVYESGRSYLESSREASSRRRDGDE